MMLMENERHTYRLQSTPDLVLRLGHMGIEELINLGNTLQAQQEHLCTDILRIEAELDDRVQPRLPLE